MSKIRNIFEELNVNPSLMVRCNNFVEEQMFSCSNKLKEKLIWTVLFSIADPCNDFCNDFFRKLERIFHFVKLHLQRNNFNYVSVCSIYQSNFLTGWQKI